MTLGERIKYIRGEVSREKFSPMTGISKTTLVNYETGVSSPASEYLQKLLRMFPEIEPAWLLTGDGEILRMIKEEQMNIGGRLKTTRDELHHTQKVMASLIGISVQMWQGYESGSSVPGGKVLTRLCDLNININWLLTGKGEMWINDASHTSPPESFQTELQRVCGESTKSRKDFIKFLLGMLDTINDMPCSTSEQMQTR